MYLEALVRSPGVSGRVACSFRTDWHSADEAGQMGSYSGTPETHRNVRYFPDMQPLE